jgi:hypothetical protein
MSASETQTGQKRIEDLTLHEFDMVYSLMRVGDWSDCSIQRSATGHIQTCPVRRQKGARKKTRRGILR